MEKNTIPIILAGGAGSRLKGKAEGKSPKQFLPLLSDKPMIVETLERMQGPDFCDPVIIANSDDIKLTRQILGEHSLTCQKLIVEPCRKNTAAAICAAALYCADHSGDEAVIIILPCDHKISDEKAFLQTLNKAANLADTQNLVCIGINPGGPDTSYGYIHRSEKDSHGNDIFTVRKFVEKPSLEKALQYYQSGEYLWNSGIYIARAGAILNLAQTHAPEILKHVQNAFENGKDEDNVFHLNGDDYEAIQAQSFDHAIAERADTIKGVIGDFGWADIGTPEKLEQARAANA